MKQLSPKKIQMTEGRQTRALDLKRALPDDVAFESLHINNPDALPPGIEINDQGILQGKPNQGASLDSPYEISVDFNDERYALTINIQVGIQMRPEDIRDRQSQIWQAIATNTDLPDDFADILNRPISKTDIYHLLERFASFIVWNADDRRLAKGGKKIRIRDVSDKFDIYDFDVCLVATPKDLFANNRGLGDALETARGMVKEAHRRRWQVEFGGFDKMAVAGWEQAQSLNQSSRHKMTVKNYEPPYAAQVNTADEYAEPE